MKWEMASCLTMTTSFKEASNTRKSMLNRLKAKIQLLQMAALSNPLSLRRNSDHSKRMTVQLAINGWNCSTWLPRRRTLTREMLTLTQLLLRETLKNSHSNLMHIRDSLLLEEVPKLRETPKICKLRLDQAELEEAT